VCRRIGRERERERGVEVEWGERRGTWGERERREREIFFDQPITDRQQQEGPYRCKE